MKRFFIVIGLVAVILAGYDIIASRAQGSSLLVTGLVMPEGTRKSYEETLLVSYDSEPYWKVTSSYILTNQPDIAGSAGVVVDINEGTILFEKYASKQYKIASLTKIMTAVVALEHKKIDDKLFVSEDAASVGENSMQISAGEIYLLEELLYGLILHSGNDAAYAIAEGVAGDVDTFIDWMNIKAKELGLKNTYFADPSGLDNATYSTPLDLAKLTRYALKNPEFKKIVATVEKELASDGHKYMYLYNQTNLLTTYPGVKGVKTGFTEEAGLCLVTYAENEGREVVGVVLNSVDRKGDMVLMLDWGFGLLGVEVAHDLL